MEEDNFRMELFKEGEEKELLALLRICFGAESMDDSTLNWRYRNYPWSVFGNTIVVKKGDIMAGAISLWPMPIRISEKRTLDVALAGGAATLPQFRNRGLWWSYMAKAKTLAKDLGSALILGYVTPKTPTYKARVTRGVKELFKQPCYVKILDYSNFFRSALLSREFQNALRTTDLKQRIISLDDKILIVPEDNKPFTIIIRNGEISIAVGLVDKPTITIKGEISDLISAKGISGILRLVAGRKIRVKFSVMRIRRVYRVLQVLRRVT